MDDLYIYKGTKQPGRSVVESLNYIPLMGFWLVVTTYY